MNSRVKKIYEVLFYICLFSMLIWQIILLFRFTELEKKVKKQDEINEYIFNRIEGYHE